MHRIVQPRRSQRLKNVETYAARVNSSSSEEYEPPKKLVQRRKLSSKDQRNRKEPKLWHDNFMNMVGGTGEPSNTLNQDLNAISRPVDKPIWILDHKMRRTVQPRRSQRLKNVDTYAARENSLSSEEYEPLKKLVQQAKLSSNDQRNRKEPKLWHDNFMNPVGGTGGPSNTLNQDLNGTSRPVDKPIWIGSIFFSYESFGMINGLAAYISNNATAKVVEVARQLPPLLHLEMVDRKDVWPVSFKTFPPTDIVIDLYILPVEIRSVDFDGLINDMTGKDIALRARINDVPVLVFTSLQLTFKYWRTTSGRLYLWAAVLGENAFFPNGVDKHGSIGFSNSMPSNTANEVHSATECQGNVHANIHSEQDEQNLDVSVTSEFNVKNNDSMFPSESACTVAGAELEEQQARRADDGGIDEQETNGLICDSIGTEADAKERISTDKYPEGSISAIGEETCSGATVSAIPICFAEPQPNTAESICRLDHSSAQSLYSSSPTDIGGAVILIGGDDHDYVEAPSDASLQENVPSAAIKFDSIERTSVDKDAEVAIEGVIREETSNGAIDAAIPIETRETQPNSTKSSHRLEQSSAEDICPSCPPDALILLDTEEDDLLDSEAPSNVPDATLQSASEEQGECSSDKLGKYSLGKSVLDMASTFNDGTEEISSADNCKEQVGPYLVNSGCAPVLHAIMEKHGDIAKDYPMKSSKMLTFALEMVCEAVSNLEAVKFVNLRRSHLQSLHSAIVDAEFMKLDVKWLRNRYEELSEAVDQIKEYKELKARRKNMRKMIADKKNAISLKKVEIFKLQCEIVTAERQFSEVKAKTKSIKKVKGKCKHFRRNSLADGLL